MLKKYISIETKENLEAVKSKIKREAGTLNLRVLSPAGKLYGNKKVLTLYYVSSGYAKDYIKVDGPGFLIDELERFFVFNKR